MDIYVAWMQVNDYETEPYNIGVYSTKEKAENAILDALREANQEALTLEIYASQEEPYYIFGVEQYILDN